MVSTTASQQHGLLEWGKVELRGVEDWAQEVVKAAALPPYPVLPLWLGSPTEVSLILRRLNSRYRSEKTHWGLWGFTQETPVAPSAPILYSGSHFGIAVPLGAEDHRIGL